MYLGYSNKQGTGVNKGREKKNGYKEFFMFTTEISIKT